MQNAGFDPDASAYQVFIKALDDNGERRRAVLSKTVDHTDVGLRPQIYGAVIGMCLRGGRLDDALRVYRDMLELGPQPNEFTCNWLIKHCGKSGRWETSLEVCAMLVLCDMGLMFSGSNE